MDSIETASQSTTVPQGRSTVRALLLRTDQTHFLPMMVTQKKNSLPLDWTQLGKIVFGASDEQRGFISAKTKLHPKTEVEFDIVIEPKMSY